MHYTTSRPLLKYPQIKYEKFLFQEILNMKEWKEKIKGNSPLRKLFCLCTNGFVQHTPCEIGLQGTDSFEKI